MSAKLSHPRALTLWAKSNPQHPLWCHLIDVALVVMVLWDTVFTASTKSRIARTLRCDEATARLWLIWLAAMHDLGKATADFQTVCHPLWLLVKAKNLQARGGKGLPHGRLSAKFMVPMLTERGWSGACAQAISNAIGAHHGTVERPEEPKLEPISNRQLWRETRTELVRIVEDALGLESLRSTTTPREPVNTAGLHEIAGVVSYADWIGSAMVELDEFKQLYGLRGYEQRDSVEEYTRDAKRLAELTLRQFGWQPTAPFTQRGWETALPRSGYAPNELQRTVEKLLDEHPGTRLLLIEAPMGEGKTEAALYAAQHWLSRLDQSGAYIALPTQATSNAMYQRVTSWISAVYGELDERSTQSLLVHGGLIRPDLFDRIARATMHKVEVHQEGSEEERRSSLKGIFAFDWFLKNRKRGLLAPFGTGTVDQALLGVLRARHQFVRLAGLAGKTVILDEIHAYDAYTGTLIKRLLEYLGRLECTVVLLSATLPEKARHEFVGAFLGRGDGAGGERDASYPRITAAGGDDVRVVGGIATSDRSRKALRFEFIPECKEAALDALLSRLGDRGCAAFITNSVGSGQELYRLAKDKYGHLLEHLILFHSRFTAGRRQELEEQVLGLFSRDGRRPQGRALVIATQVIEQSLDLDFDLMASDIAPVDLLLQRSGRLHRHDRGENRPPHLREPVLLIRAPEDTTTAPGYKDTAGVYDDAVLLRTHTLLLDRHDRNEGIAIPGDVHNLVEEVYGEEASATPRMEWEKAWTAAVKARRDKEKLMAKAASGMAIPKSGYEEALSFWEQDEVSFSDDEDSRAIGDVRPMLTRLGKPTVLVILSEAVDSDTTISIGGKNPIPKGDVIRMSLVWQKALAECTHAAIRIPEYWVEDHWERLLAKTRDDFEWLAKTPLKFAPVLRFCDDRLCLSNGTSLVWNKELGLRREGGHSPESGR